MRTDAPPSGTVAVPQTGTARTHLVRRRHAGRPAMTPRRPAVRTASLAETAYARVKADIFEFRRLPGERFSENEVAAQVGVSRTPVREALYRLASEGFLSVHARSGWSVKPLDFERFDHLYDVRVILESAAIARLCATPPGPVLLSLKRTWAVPVGRRCTDGAEVSRLDEAFHAALVQATGNTELARIHADIQERIRIVRRLDFTSAERVHCTYGEHAAILAAILAGKPAQAASLLKAHIQVSKQEVRKISLDRLAQAHRTAAGP